MKKRLMMELELGLALPINSASAADHPMILKLGLDLNSTCSNGSVEKNKRICHHHHYDYYDDDENEAQSKDLSLLQLWSTTGSHPNQDDHPNIHKNNNMIDDEEDVDEEGKLVGWPPIKELLHRKVGHGHDHFPVRKSKSSMYVKVKMEGVPIGRKIDLSLYNSYQALTNTFIHMFSNYSENRNRDGDYTILYQDKQGDWMVATDVPWETFVESAQRMEIYNKY